MKKLVLLVVIIIFLITLVGTGTAMAIGPYKAIYKNPNLEEGIYGDMLLLQTNPDGYFVQWFEWHGYKHFILQCTDGMNPDAIASKLSEGWVEWSPGNVSDPRYDPCNGNEYIYKGN
ncbi:hypothetical protein ES702_03642 [subsurface metagenome]